MTHAAREFAGAVVRVVQGDLTAQDVDAVVNAANEHLEHGGGVAAAISRAGGPSIQEESRQWVRDHGPVGPGVAAVTGAGKLRAAWVVHTVGPRYEPGQKNEALLAQAVSAALDAAVGTGARSLAFPAISAGIFGYPRDEATSVIAGTVAGWLQDRPGEIDEVRLVGYDAGTTHDFVAALESVE